MEELVSAIKLGEVIGKSKKKDDTLKIVAIVVSVIGIIAAVTTAVCLIVKCVKNRLDYYEDDFDDLFEDDFDDLFEDEEDEEKLPDVTEDDFVEE